LSYRSGGGFLVLFAGLVTLIATGHFGEGVCFSSWDGFRVGLAATVQYCLGRVLYSLSRLFSGLADLSGRLTPRLEKKQRNRWPSRFALSAIFGSDTIL
jgi:hypothetical protein